MSGKKSLLMKANERIKWIDCAKMCAIVAVIVDHCYNVIYTNRVLAFTSYFSVSLFVLLAGVTARISFVNKKNNWVFKRMLSLFLQYSIATFVLLVCYQRFFDLKTYLTHLFCFSIQAPFYFLVFFFQLLLITPFLIQWCEYCDNRVFRFVWHLLTLIFLCFVAAIFIRYTMVLQVHGGGKYLFGGTYIILYYMGILLAQINLFEKLKRYKAQLFIFSLISWFFWWLYAIPNQKKLDECFIKFFGGGDGLNPPYACLAVFGIISLFVSYSFFSLLEEMYLGRKIVDFCSGIGRCTLHIFMYHLLARDFALSYLDFLKINDVIWIIFVFGFTTIAPVGMLYLVRKCKDYYVELVCEKGKKYEKNNAE